MNYENCCSCGLLWRGRRKEGNVLFNDALNTFYLRLYGVTHMVKYHSDSEREETRCRYMGYSFQLAARVLYMHHLTDRITHTTAFVTPVVEHWLEREIAQWVHHEGCVCVCVRVRACLYFYLITFYVIDYFSVITFIFVYLCVDSVIYYFIAKEG